MVLGQVNQHSRAVAGESLPHTLSSRAGSPLMAHLVDLALALVDRTSTRAQGDASASASAGWASALGPGAFSCLRLMSKRPDTGLSAVVCIPTLPRLSPPRDTLNSGFLPSYPSSPTFFLPYSPPTLSPLLPLPLPNGTAESYSPLHRVHPSWAPSFFHL